MSLSTHVGAKSSGRILGDPGLLSAPKAAAAPTAAIDGEEPPEWADLMRAAYLELDNAERQQEQRDDARVVAGKRSGSLAAAWHAIPLLVRVMFALDLLMGVLYVVARRARNAIGKPLLAFFDLNGEMNLPSWYSALQLALIGGLLVVFATTQLRRGARAAWALMLGGVAFCFLSLDEATGLHENFGYWLDHLRHRRNTAFNETGFWMLICAPAFLGALVMLGLGARRYLRGRRGVVIKLIAGVVLFVAAAAGVEMLTNFVTPGGTASRIVVLLEETGEMLGATVMLWGVLELLRSHGVRLLTDDEDAVTTT
jgi:hypothetical protein